MKLLLDGSINTIWSSLGQTSRGETTDYEDDLSVSRQQTDQSAPAAAKLPLHLQRTVRHGRTTPTHGEFY